MGARSGCVAIAGLRRGLWRVRGAERGLEFLTAYVVEYALSVDNLFVFLMVFQYFRVGARAAAPAALLGRPRRLRPARAR